MGSLDVFAIDEESAEQGIWATVYTPTTDEVKAGRKKIRLRIRSINSEKYRTEYRKLERSWRPQFMANDGVLKPSEQDEFDSVLIGRAVVTAWEGVTDAQNAEIPYSQRAVQEEMRRLPLLRRLVWQMARNDEAFKPAQQLREERETLAKN